MKNKLKTGVFGVGSLGQHHARIYSELASAELVGVYDINSGRASKIAKKHRTRAFDDIDNLASNIEAASVVVPTDKHYEIFSALAEKNTHMLVEKPIAVSTEQAESMVRIARKKNLILQVGHIERFNPIMQFLEENLEKPRFIEAIRLAEYPPARENGVPRGTEVSVVLDLMIHDLDIILHLVNSPVNEIRAVGVPVLSSSEDIANVRLSFENGCVANITASRISRERIRKIRVFQEDTYVSLDYMKQAGVLCRKEAAGIKTDKVPIEKGEPLAAELDSFVQCVQQQGQPVVSGRHASDALKLAIDICKEITTENTEAQRGKLE
ncbi:Gfo/Idh/MocA family oxidoreductase [Verrucomicrobiota bacterium]